MTLWLGLDIRESTEVTYGDLIWTVEKYFFWIEDEDAWESIESLPGRFLDAAILLKNAQFSNPDDIAQLVIDGKVALMPGCDRLVDKYRIVTVRLCETQEIFLFYTPDNGEGKLDVPTEFSWDFEDSLRAIVNNSISLDQTHLVICTHSHFLDIKKLIGNVEAARAFLSVFDKIDDTEIVKLVESVITSLRKLWASDFHVKPWLNTAQLQMRLHGLLQPIPGSAKRVSLEVWSKIANVLTNHSGKQLVASTPMDGSFRFVNPMTLQRDREGSGGLIGTQNPGLFETDHRVSIIPTHGGNFSSVVRLMKKPEWMITLEELDYENTGPLLEAGKIGSGLVIISGPTWSGKSTTLAALFNEIKDPTKNTITVEDPIEMYQEWIMQIQVNKAKDLTMAKILRSILRHDPDRIMVGETRDTETAALSIEAANTGHSVFTTLHANTAADCIRRMMKLGIDAIDISGTIKYLFAQRLVEKLSPLHDFVEFYDATEELSQIFSVEIPGPVYVRRSLQSEGIIGRLPVYERIWMSSQLKDMIETQWQQISSTRIEQVALQEGFVPMEIYWLRQVLLGKTSLLSLTRYIDAGRMQTFRDLALKIIEESAVREVPLQ